MKLAVACTCLLLLSVSLPGTAAAKSCPYEGETAGNGLAIVKITTKNVTCPTARKVAKTAMNRSDGQLRTSVRVNGHKYKCEILKLATETDPGGTARTKIRCSASGGRAVRFQLGS